MPAGTHYFKLGLFLILGFLLIAAALTYFGAGTMFIKSIPAQSFFRESVQGLSIGSPVKYRGVQIGNVSRIGFVSSRYPKAEGEASMYVLVDLEIFVDKLRGDADDMREWLQRQIDQGLRLRLTSQGLTGVVYLEADFFVRTAVSAESLGFEPDVLFIPSSPSAMKRVEQALSSIDGTLGKIENIDFAQLGVNANDFLRTLNEKLIEADVSRLGELASADLEELRSVLRRVNELLSAPEVERLAPSVLALIKRFDHLAQAIDEPVRQGVDDLRVAAANLASSTGRVQEILTDKDLEEGIEALPGMLAAAQNATMQLARSGERLETLLAGIRQMSLTQRDVVESILIETRTTMMNLSDITEDAAQNPSRLLLGGPPKPIFSETDEETPGETP